ncbi:thiol:disulfide interchange protein DsbD [Robiginitalea myxolifaciens]|uniref:Thiol:disulfide interchange protein DsbD n=1 Tax=Robiginitalea myxolifaciens TaxID=400055 RepID=A0A1I6H0Q9_9FLAO|nr:cytochrome c biogenesis protein CcdA [Robiginitalea myxolifaciens]SFR47891.1 thiol:disulfide interchange protein DsbD [Robiginitalea myxolifaciens]
MAARIATILIFFTSLTGFGQLIPTGLPEEPVRWDQSFEQINDSTYRLVFTADIEENWHLYCKHSDEDGAMPMIFGFEGVGERYVILDTLVESPTRKAYNDIFGVDETFFENNARMTQDIRLLDSGTEPIRVTIEYQVCDEVCIPGEHTFDFYLSGGEPIGNTENLQANISASDSLKSAALRLQIKNPEMLREGSAGEVLGGGQGIWGIFGLGILGGFIALLTPCVFPMIPLTVSFFTRKNGAKASGVGNAVLYGMFIVLIYFLLSLPFHLMDSADGQFLNALATNIWVNLLFFLIFVLFAISFFGYFEITLPASWAARMDGASQRLGGAPGIFFMALTLAIVSFSCTGPILGGLLGSTALSEGDVALKLTAGMTGFGLALGLPFALFALFPNWLQKMPKSGQWMETVKVVLGFLELALALKFLSNADLVGHWGLLKREIFLGIWILLTLGLAAYLMGWFRFKKSEGPAGISITRRLGALACLLFSAYLGYGLVTGQPLKQLSGFPPPDFYSLRAGASDCPLGLECYKDFEAGREVSRATGKPMLLDFTGWACVNCRRMEEQVWSDPEVYRLLRDEFVLISLYVDDREELAEEAQFIFHYPNGKTRPIEDIGDLWGTFQTVNFGAISQPYYIQLSADLELLAPPIQNTDVATYRQWLQSARQTATIQ